MKKVIYAVCAAFIAFAVMTAVVSAEPLEFEQPVYEVDNDVVTVGHAVALSMRVTEVSYTVDRSDYKEPANQLQRGAVPTIDKVPIYSHD